MTTATACGQPELPQGSQLWFSPGSEGRGQRAQPFSPGSLAYLLSLQIPHIGDHMLSAVQNGKSLC